MNWLTFVGLIIVAGATLLHGIEIRKINEYIDRRIGTLDDDSLSLQNKIVIKQNEAIIKRIDDLTELVKDLGCENATLKSENEKLQYV